MTHTGQEFIEDVRISEQYTDEKLYIDQISDCQGDPRGRPGSQIVFCTASPNLAVALAIKSYSVGDRCEAALYSSGVVNSSWIPSGSLKLRMVIPKGGRSLTSPCSTPCSSKRAAALCSSARFATPRLR